VRFQLLQDDEVCKHSYDLMQYWIMLHMGNGKNVLCGDIHRLNYYISITKLQKWECWGPTTVSWMSYNHPLLQGVLLGNSIAYVVQIDLILIVWVKMRCHTEKVLLLRCLWNMWTYLGYWQLGADKSLYPRSMFGSDKGSR